MPDFPLRRCRLIAVTGAAGMVGRALVRHLEEMGAHVAALTRETVDLEDRAATRRWFLSERPDAVFHVAGKVGGIGANVADPVGFLAANVRIAVNAMEAAHEAEVEKQCYLGSSCIYPRVAPQPIPESALLSGPPEPTNAPYAMAKITGLALAAAYAKQHRDRFICPMLCNVYGTGDSFDLENSHVLSALVRRFVDAREEEAPIVTLWGTGAPRREFLHVDDAVEGLALLMERHEDADPINLGSGEAVSIRDLAELVRREARYEGEIRWDTSRPDGFPCKVMDVSHARALGFRPRVPLAAGVARTVREYEAIRAAHVSADAGTES